MQVYLIASLERNWNCKGECLNLPPSICRWHYCFCPQNLEYLLNIKKVLILFHLASGLQVNFHKTSTLGVLVAESWVQNVAQSLLCEIGKLPFTSLGLPIGGKTSQISLWDPIIEKMKKKLASWKGNLLSLGGRLTLLKSSISRLPLYCMSIFPITKGVIDKISRIQRKFLWSGSLDSEYLPLVS